MTEQSSGGGGIDGPAPMNIGLVEKVRSDLNQHREPMLQFFSYAHLPEGLRCISKPFCDLADEMVKTLPRNPERTAALRKLLEAKDCAVRASIFT